MTFDFALAEPFVTTTSTYYHTVERIFMKKSAIFGLLLIEGVSNEMTGRARVCLDLINEEGLEGIKPGRFIYQSDNQKKQKKGSRSRCPYKNISQ